MTTELAMIVKQIAAETFAVDANDVSLASTPPELENWDSIQHLNFILALEARFGIQLSPDEMEGIRSIGDAVRIVAEAQHPGR